MPRYFLEVSYLGTRFSGFQVQDNARTIQWEVERALSLLLRQPIACTGSSRTDAGVHALGNYFHFDSPTPLAETIPYRLNAILPPDISARSLRRELPDAHCRFDAVARHYRYLLFRQKNPFLQDRGWFYPYVLRGDVLREVAAIVRETSDFTSFAKRNAQVHTYNCTILSSKWEETEEGWAYEVIGNRFLRGMVRGLVGTMLQAGKGKIDVATFRDIIQGNDNTKADFTPPGRGLYLCEVRFPEDYFTRSFEGS